MVGEGCRVCTSLCCFPSNLGDPFMSPNMVLFWVITQESSHRQTVSHISHGEKCSI